MTRIPSIQIALVLGTLVLTAGASVVEADFPANVPWSFEAIAGITGGDVGKHTSIAFHPATGKPYISYYDETNGDLRLIYPHDTAGNCGPNNEWYCEAVDTDDDVGQYSSIDYFHDDATGENKIGIAYYDATNDALKVAIWSTTPFVGWKISTIDSEGLFGDFIWVGRNGSLKFDFLGGGVHVAYSIKHNVSNIRGMVYAHSVSSGGNCGLSAAAGKWQCDPVASASSADMYISLGLTDSYYPAIAFSDRQTGLLNICVEAGGTWPCVIVDHLAGGPVSLTIDQSNLPHMAYYHPVSGELSYATYVGALGNCGLGGVESQYQCDSLDTVGDGQSQVGISIALDLEGYPVIAYEDASDPTGTSVLNVARPIYAHGSVVGDCGPIVGSNHSWKCTTIDDATQGGGGGDLYEADFAAVAVGPNGLAAIAYYEYDDFNNEGRLKFAGQEGVLFKDGFENGDTSAWSDVTP